MLFACAEELEFVVLVRLYKGVGIACQDACQMLQLEVLRQGLYKLYDKLHVCAPVKARLGIHAVVAVVAVVLRIILSEVIEQQLPAASPGLCVGHRFH